jgi:RHS repeat-associated protein
VQGLDIDEPLAMLRSSETSFYEADGVSSVTSLSNSAGSLAETYAYDSFGKLTDSSGSLTNPFQYTARESDPETGLYYYRARYYDNAIGRFLRQDPTGFRSGINFYAYVGNDPADSRDPEGLYTLKGFTAAQQVDMMNAINAVRKKLLTDCPSCVSDPDLRKKLLGYLGGDNDGSGQTFIFTKEKIAGCMVTRGITKTTYVGDWKQKGCECLPAKIIHELVHDTWGNILNFFGNSEKGPEGIEDACYPHPFGDGCKF